MEAIDCRCSFFHVKAHYFHQKQQLVLLHRFCGASFLPAAQTLATVAKANHALAILVVAAVYTYPKRLYCVLSVGF